MKKLLIGMLFSSLVFSGCNPGPAPTSQVRFINTMPDSTGINIFFGQDLITNIATPVAFRAAFPAVDSYRTVNAGTLTYSLCPADVLDCPAEVKNKAIALDTNKQTSVFLVGTKSTADNTGTDARPLEILSLGNDTPTPAAGKAKLRVLHAAAVVAAKSVDMFLTAPTTDITTITTPAQLSYKGVYDYRELNAGSYRIRLTAPNTTSPVLVDSDTLLLEAGKIYTAVVSNPDAANANKGVTLLLDK